MSKVAFFGHISPNFFDDFFLEKSSPQNFLPPPPQKFFGPYKFFYPFRPENSFLDFIDLKNVF